MRALAAQWVGTLNNARGKSRVLYEQFFVQGVASAKGSDVPEIWCGIIFLGFYNPMKRKGIQQRNNCQLWLKKGSRLLLKSWLKFPSLWDDQIEKHLPMLEAKFRWVCISSRRLRTLQRLESSVDPSSSSFYSLYQFIIHIIPINIIICISIIISISIIICISIIVSISIIVTISKFNKNLKKNKKI